MNYIILGHKRPNPMVFLNLPVAVDMGYLCLCLKHWQYLLKKLYNSSINFQTMNTQKAIDNSP